jgi:tetratricopeptide (TPR) repeat protein
MNISKLRTTLQVAVVFIFFVSSFSQAQNLVPQLYDQGMKLYAAKDFSGATDYLGQVVDMEPAHDQARYYLVYSYSMVGQLDKALQHARILAKKYPTQKQYADLVAQLEKNLAGLLQKKADQRKAHSIPKEVILGGYQSKDSGVYTPKLPEKTRDIKPPKKLTKLDKAVRMIDEGNNASATILLDEIIKNEPKNARALHYKGVMEFNSGYFSQAKEWFEKALKIDTENFQALFLLGDCYRAEEDYEKAAQQFKKAIAIKKDVFAQINLANCYAKLNKLKMAEKIFEQVLEKDAIIADALLGLAQIKLYSGYTTEASDMVNKVLSSEPKNAEAHYIKGQILLDSNLNDDAASHANTALNLFPGNLSYKSLYALALIRSYDVAKGLEVAASILQQYPDSIQAKLALAEGLILSGAFSDAEEHLEKVESRMRHPDVYRLRAMVAVKNGKMEQAGELYRSYIELAEGRPRPYLEYAAFLESVENLADAKKAYEEIAELFKDTAFARTAKDKVAEIEAKMSPSAAPTPEPTDGFRKGKVKF